MTDLATRIEQATGPDRVNDREIAKLYGWHRVEPRHTRSKDGAWIAPEDWIGEYSDGRPKLDSLHGTTLHREVPRFTASIDAAMTLVPEGRILRQYMATRFVPHSCEVAVSWAHGGWVGHSDHSFALALCAAALRAREARP